MEGIVDVQNRVVLPFAIAFLSESYTPQLCCGWDKLWSQCNPSSLRHEIPHSSAVGSFIY